MQSSGRAMKEIFLLVFVFFRTSVTFISVHPKQRFSAASPLCLQKLTNSELPPIQSMPLATRDWDFHLLEKDDLPAASTLALECFYRPRLKLDLDGMNGIEKRLWGGLMNFYTDMDQSDNYNGNYLGFRSRSSQRLDKPSLELSTYSFILAATPAAPATADGTTQAAKEKSDIAAIVEICLERPNGKLAPPVQNPFRSPTSRGDEQPYLCNLCVSNTHRRKGLGRLLCELCEELVQMHWEKDIMYLHVEQNNTAAQALYLGMGYELVTPGLSAWEKKMEGIENILYYSKPLVRRWIDSADSSVASSVQKAGARGIVGEGDDIDTDANVLGMKTIDMTIASNIMRSNADR